MKQNVWLLYEIKGDNLWLADTELHSTRWHHFAAYLTMVYMLFIETPKILILISISKDFRISESYVYFFLHSYIAYSKPFFPLYRWSQRKSRELLSKAFKKMNVINYGKSNFCILMSMDIQDLILLCGTETHGTHFWS